MKPQLLGLCAAVVCLSVVSPAYSEGLLLSPDGTYVDVGGADTAGGLHINNSGVYRGLPTDFPIPTNPISFPGAAYTFVWGANDVGQAVGSYYTTCSPSCIGNGFVYSNGAYTAIAVPGESKTVAFGINNLGQVVGWTDSGGLLQGFLDSNGTFTTLNDPQGVKTVAYGINDLGQIVGDYVDSNGNPYIFLYSNGVYTTITIPGSTFYAGSYGYWTDTDEPTGINDAGQIVGDFSFVVTSPLPPTLPLFATGLGVLGLLGWRRMRKAQAVA